MDVFEGYERVRQVNYINDMIKVLEIINEHDNGGGWEMNTCMGCGADLGHVTNPQICSKCIPTKKLEDMPIGVPFVVQFPNNSNCYVSIRVDEKNFDMCEIEYNSLGECSIGNCVWSTYKLTIVDWFEDSPQPWPQSHLCSCSIVALMQGGCKCGGK